MATVCIIVEQDSWFFLKGKLWQLVMVMTRFVNGVLPSRKLCSLTPFTVFPQHHLPWEHDVRTHWWLSAGKRGVFVGKNGVGDAESSGSLQLGKGKVKQGVGGFLLLF